VERAAISYPLIGVSGSLRALSLVVKIIGKLPSNSAGLDGEQLVRPARVLTSLVAHRRSFVSLRQLAKALRTKWVLDVIDRRAEAGAEPAGAAP
jgi:hypothetical protein